jgi:hypothetical protein
MICTKSYTPISGVQGLEINIKYSPIIDTTGTRTRGSWWQSGIPTTKPEGMLKGALNSLYQHYFPKISQKYITSTEDLNADHVTFTDLRREGV